MSEDLPTASPLDETAAAAPALADRLRGAIWGQLVGDAFCLGAHWIYDLDELAQTFPGGVRGFETPQAGHYHAGKQSGEQTHYGDVALLALESAAERGGFDAADFGARFVRFFGSPDYRGYLDHATRSTLELARKFAAEHPGESFDYQHGAHDDQLAAAARLAPVITAHWPMDRAALLALAEAATRVTQNHDFAVACMKTNALILAGLFEGLEPVAAVRRAAQEIGDDAVSETLRAAMDAQPKSVTEATLEFGQTCPLPGSFPASAHCFLKHAASFRNAMRANAQAGGDNAGRGALIGGWLGAALGLQAIPAEWRERLAARERIHAQVEKLLG